MICQISQGHNAPPGFGFSSSSMRTNKSKLELKLVGSKEVLLEGEGSQSPTDSTNIEWALTEKATAAAAAMALVKHTSHHVCVPGHGAHVACGMCAQRAANIVEVGAYSCCWQCVAEKYDQVSAAPRAQNQAAASCLCHDHHRMGRYTTLLDML
jgi:hypothetical protein